MKCKKCFKELPDSYSFCDFCGTPLTQPPFVMDDPQPKPRIREKIPAKKGTGRIAVMAVFVGFLIFLLNFIFSFRIGFSGDMVKSRVNSLDLENILDADIEEGVSAVDYIYENIDRNFLEVTNAKLKDLRSFLINSDIQEFAAVKLGEYAAWAVEGKDLRSALDPHEITNFVYSQRELFSQEFGYTMDKKDYSELESSLKDAGIGDLLSVDGLSSAAGFDLNIISYFSNFITAAIIFAVIMGIFVGLFFASGKIFSKFLSSVSLPLMISGGLTGVISLGLLIFFLAGKETVLTAILSALTLPFGVFLGCTGLFELIAGMILVLLGRHLSKASETL